MDTKSENLSEKLMQALNFFAVGLYRLDKLSQKDNVVALLPLNLEFRQGWELLCYICFQAGELPPRTLSELVQWLRTPVSHWEVSTRLLAAKFNAPLIEASGILSALCIELASPLVEAINLRQEMEDALFRQIYQFCWDTGDVDGYSNVREFINRSKVLEDVYSGITVNLNWHDEVRALLTRCYETIPKRCIRQDSEGKYIARCPHCGWVLEWKRDEATCYEGGSCAELKGDLGEHRVRQPYISGMVRTTSGIQRYVAAPETALLSLVDTVSAWWGVHCTLYPNLDAYDLLIEFPNGKRWAVDLKDYKRAVSLAFALRDKPFKFEPRWDKAFYVFPDYRANQAYLVEFGNYWQREKDVHYVGLQKLIALAKKEAGIS